MKIVCLRKFVVRIAVTRFIPFLLLATLWVSSGCGGTQEKGFDPFTGPMPSVSVIVPAVSSENVQLSMQMLMKQFPKARWITLPAIDVELETCLRENRVLLIPAVESLPVEVWGTLKTYLEHGGPAVFLGCNPFRARVQLVEDKPRSENEFHNTLAQTARESADFSPIVQWRHTNNRDMPGAVCPVEAQELSWPGVWVEANDVDSWDALIMDNIPASAIRADENALVFYARGSRDTAHVSLKGTERDGSVWSASITVTQSWQLFVIHETELRYLSGGKNRGGPDDHFILSRARTMEIGLDTRMAGQAPSHHLFGLSDIRMVSDPRAPETITSWPDIDLLSPPYRRYGFPARQVECLTRGQTWPIGSSLVQGPRPRSRGLGGEKGTPYRWIPVFQARDADGTPRGWPASIYVEPQTNGVTKKWAWIGLDISNDSIEAAAAMTLACARRLQNGMFLYKVGSPQFTFEPESNIDVSARWTTPVHRSPNLRVVAELYKEGSDYLLRRVVGPSPSADGIVRIHLGRAPDIEEFAQDYTLRILLEDSSARGKIIDRVDQSIKCLGLPRTPNEQEWVTMRGARFSVGRRPVFMLGVNYEPWTTHGRMSGESGSYGLDSSLFDPELVRKDLAQLENGGVNAVSIQYLTPDQAPQLKYFLEEARRHGIWVQLFVEGLNPLHPNLRLAEQLIEAADLRNESQVFALNLANAPRLGPYEERCQFDGEWQNWLIEQYGSVAHAEKAIGGRLWKKGRAVTGPPDEELIVDGKHRAAVKVYRRFVSDFVSRRYGYIVRWLRQHHLRQLVGAQTDDRETDPISLESVFPLDPAVGATHLDFISPNGGLLHGTPHSLMESGFITAYARAVSDGKPVLWSEFGMDVGSDPQPIDLENQVGVYRGMFEMVMKSRAAGCLGWGFPSGGCVDEQSDVGLVHPDGAWRPVGDAYRDVAHRIRNEWSAPAAWRGREMDSSGDGDGFQNLWAAWRDIYRAELDQNRMEELRPLNFGKRTGEIVIRSVGGSPYMAPAPLQSVNSEWGRIDIEGLDRDRKPGHKIAVHRQQTIQLELMNTGYATWDASAQGKARCVWVELKNEKRTQRIPVDVVRFGGSTWVRWVALDPGMWRVQPVLADVGPFGEPLDIEVLPSRK